MATAEWLEMELDKPVAVLLKRNDRSRAQQGVLVNGGQQEYVIIVNPFDSDDIAELCRGE